MPRSRVPVKGSIGKAILTGQKSTVINNTTVVQQRTTTVGGVSGVSSTLWGLIQGIPDNVLELAAINTAGLIVYDGTDIITRSIAVGSSDVTITNPTGAAGNPTIDLSAAVKADLALAATAVQPGSLAAIATSGSATDLTTGTVPSARLPIATTSLLGAVKVDGTTITITSGVISAVGGGSSPLTTKGDLYGFSTVGARIPVGTDGNVLTADSTASLGVSWQPGGGGGSGALTKIAEQVLSANATSVTFSSIPGTYRTLILKMTCQTDGATATARMDVTFNGDTGTDYAGLILFGSASGASANSALAKPAIQLDGFFTSGYPTTPSPTSGTLEIHDYAGTVFWKLARGTWFRADNISQIFGGTIGGVWNSTAAITSITLTPSSDNLIPGCVFSLYGEA